MGDAASLSRPTVEDFGFVGLGSMFAILKNMLAQSKPDFFFRNAKKKLRLEGSS